MTDHSPIISPEALVEQLDDPDLRIVDVRWILGSPGEGRAAYERGHIPGAVFLDLDTDLVAPSGPGRHPLPTPADLRERLERAGISDDDLVVAYDDSSGTTAARLWWMLDDLGHDRVAVLDGGFRAWVTAGHPVTTEPPRPRPRGRLGLRGSWGRIIDRETLAAGLGAIVLLDARAGPRYRGETEPIDRIPGHIPTARSMPTGESLGLDGRLLPSADLVTRFRGVGVSAEAGGGPVVTSCGSGVNACFSALAMRVAGLPDPLLYPGSYSDWSRAGMPVASGPEPGEPPSG